MSVIPLKADIHQRGLHVRLVPIADIRVRGFRLKQGPSQVSYELPGRAD